MAVGIPEYRLPRNVLNKEIENIKRAGVEIKFNQELGKDFTVDDLLDKQGFSAVVLAIGAHQSRRLGIPGEDLPGVYHGTQFLKDVALGKLPDVKGKRVAVVGGGAVAHRCRPDGPSPRRQQGPYHLPPNPGRDARLEGRDPCRLSGRDPVPFPHQSCGRSRSGNGDRRRMPSSEAGRIRCERPPAADSRLKRRNLKELNSSSMPTSLSRPSARLRSLNCIDGSKNIGINRNGTVTVSAESGHDPGRRLCRRRLALGPATVVEAVGQGNKVAVPWTIILRERRSKDPNIVPTIAKFPNSLTSRDYAEAKRPVIRELPVEERIRKFTEVEAGFDEHTAREECKRCLRCDLEWLESMGLSTQAKKVA